MYSESDVQSAVAAGAISPEAAEALRRHVASLNATSPVDEEQFRLVTGFNDIFVSIACLLVIFAAAATGATSGGTILGAVLVAAASWVMAEVFTRRRRMALPSIILLLAFVLGLGIAAHDLLGFAFPEHFARSHYELNGQRLAWDRYERWPWQSALMSLGGAVAAGVGALLHWLRFRVAITIAAAVGALVAIILATVAAVRNVPPSDDPVLSPVALFCGLSVFAYAMRWDISDRTRRTQRADVAFWLHLVAAPLIAHPLFRWMGVSTGANIDVATAAGVVAIYLGFALVALAVDRRALLVSALAYVLIALAQLFQDYGAIELIVALTALLIGTALLGLSAWWQPIRRRWIGVLPDRLRIALPPAA